VSGKDEYYSLFVFNCVIKEGEDGDIGKKRLLGFFKVWMRFVRFFVSTAIFILIRVISE